MALHWLEPLAVALIGLLRSRERLRWHKAVLKVLHAQLVLANLHLLLCHLLGEVHIFPPQVLYLIHECLLLREYLVLKRSVLTLETLEL